MKTAAPIAPKNHHATGLVDAGGLSIALTLSSMSAVAVASAVSAVSAWG